MKQILLILVLLSNSIIYGQNNDPVFLKWKAKLLAEKARSIPMVSEDYGLLDLIRGQYQHYDLSKPCGSLGQSLSFISEQQESDFYDDLCGAPQFFNVPSPPDFLDCSNPRLQSIELERVSKLSDVIPDNINIVMVNEAHNKPQHRAFLIHTLEMFKKKGFKYLAVEALNAKPTISECSIYGGYYTKEPTMNEMLILAEELGFQLINYDSEFGVARDSIAAVNISAKVKDFKDGKLLVYCGYGHLEGGNMLGGHLERIYKQPIFKIDQTFLRESSINWKYFSAYDCVFKQKKADQFPYILMEGKEPFVTKPNKYTDLLIVWPPVTYENGRPLWLSLLPDRVKVTVTIPKKIAERTLLVKGTATGKSGNADCIALDQTYYVNDKGEVTLYLKKGDYSVLCLDGKENVIYKKSIKVD